MHITKAFWHQYPCPNGDRVLQTWARRCSAGFIHRNRHDYGAKVDYDSLCGHYVIIHYSCDFMHHCFQRRHQVHLLLTADTVDPSLGVSPRSMSPHLLRLPKLELAVILSHLRFGLASIHLRKDLVDHRWMYLEWDPEGMEKRLLHHCDSPS